MILRSDTAARAIKTTPQIRRGRLARLACSYPDFSPALTRGFLFQFQELKGASFIQVEIRGAPNRGPRAPAQNVPMGRGFLYRLLILLSQKAAAD